MLLRPKCFLKELWLSPDAKDSLSRKGRRVVLVQWWYCHNFAIYYHLLERNASALARSLMCTGWESALSVSNTLLLQGRDWFDALDWKSWAWCWMEIGGFSTPYFTCLGIISLFTKYSCFTFRGIYHIALITDICKI